MGADQRQRATSYLLIHVAGGDDQTIVWDTVDITVGRSENRDIVVNEPEVSREHAVFRRRGEACEVADLNTGLGTLVDGKAVKVQGLQHGNVIQIGSLEIEFGQSDQPITHGKNVRFASELKEFGFSALDDAAGRTMLGFDTEDEILPAGPSASASSPRAVTEDGTVEIEGPESEALDLGAGDVEVRDLDLDLAEEIPALSESAVAEELAITAPTEPKLDKRDAKTQKIAESKPAPEPLKLESIEVPTASPVVQATPVDSVAAGAVDSVAAGAVDSVAAGAIDSVATGRTETRSETSAAGITAKLVLEVKGPAEQVEAFLEAIRDKRIQVPPIELLVRDI